MRPVCLPWSPLRLVVAEGGEDITIKVSDEGGGIARSGLPNIWTYLYSTAKSPVEMSQVGQGRVRGQAVPWVGVRGTGLGMYHRTSPWSGLGRLVLLLTSR